MWVCAWVVGQVVEEVEDEGGKGRVVPAISFIRF